MDLIPELFQTEMSNALKAYEKYIICLEKAPEECEASLVSLMKKAIHAYNTRPAGYRHGIALDKHLSIILSQSDADLPLCGIYFNLHSPYKKKTIVKKDKD